MTWRAFVVSTVETARFLWSTRKSRHHDSIRCEREQAVYIWRYDLHDLTEPLHPHRRCWLCGDYVRRWWRPVGNPCDCP